MIGIIIGATPVGLVIGYILAAIAQISETDWLWVFGVNICLILVLVIFIQCTTSLVDFNVKA